MPLPELRRRVRVCQHVHRRQRGQACAGRPCRVPQLEREGEGLRGRDLQGSLWFPRRAAGEMIAMIAAGTLDLSSIQPETVDLDHVNDGVRAAARESMGLRHWAVCPRRG